MPVDIQIRLAVAADIPALRELIEASVRGLQAGDYSQPQMDAALRTVFGVDSRLIADGTYFVAEALARQSDSPAGARERGHRAAIKAGWGAGASAKATTGGGSGGDLVGRGRDAAKIRAFFIHPDWARRGIGSMVLDACETAAMAAGFTRFEMGATLTGAKLFRERGYVALQPIDLPLENGITLPIIHMVKEARR